MGLTNTYRSDLTSANKNIDYNNGCYYNGHYYNQCFYGEEDYEILLSNQRARTAR